MALKSRIVIHPPDEEGGRSVRYDDVILGRAFRIADVLEFLRRAGFDPDTIQLTDTSVVDWRGGGPDVWWPKPPDEE